MSFYQRAVKAAHESYVQSIASQADLLARVTQARKTIEAVDALAHTLNKTPGAAAVLDPARPLGLSVILTRASLFGDLVRAINAAGWPLFEVNPHLQRKDGAMFYTGHGLRADGLDCVLISVQIVETPASTEVAL